MGLGTIVFVGALAAGATGAFFSDTETSTGNTFAAGALDLTIDNTSYGFDWNDPSVDLEDATGAWGPNTANSWTLRDLDTCGPNNDQPCLFFSFRDLKPGDYGEDTISLHVQNDAFACMAFDLTATPENIVNEPEVDAGDTSDNGPLDGELQDYLSFLFWYDDGDNVFESDETIIEDLSGPPGDAFLGEWLAIAEGGETPDTPLQGGQTSYIGKGWCFGTMVQAPVLQDGVNTNPPNAETDRIGFTCNGAGDHNIAQTDGISVDVHFHAVQSRNNADFLCSSLPPLDDEEPVQRAEVGADLATYVAPVGEACDVNVPADFATIQAAIDDASTVNGDTICVAAGSYGEDVSITKEVELAGAGAASTFVIGQTSGEAGAMVIAANNVTVRGFDIIDATGGIAALRISGGRTGILVNSNRLSSVTGGTNAFLTDGGQTNVTVSNNILNGVGAGQIAYVNGTASVALASTNVDFFENDFTGTIVAGGLALGNESTASDITENDFADSITSTYAILENFVNDANVNYNNFNGVGGIKVRDGDAGAGLLDAENNWWGAAVPAGHTAGDVDDDPKEASALPLN